MEVGEIPVVQSSVEDNCLMLTAVKFKVGLFGSVF